MAVEGHNEVKNEFHKAVFQLKARKGQVYGWIGGLVEVVALTTILIIAL